MLKQQTESMPAGIAHYKTQFCNSVVWVVGRLGGVPTAVFGWLGGVPLAVFGWLGGASGCWHSRSTYVVVHTVPT
jgi:hypothetical protein